MQVNSSRYPWADGAHTRQDTFQSDSAILVPASRDVWYATMGVIMLYRAGRDQEPGSGGVSKGWMPGASGGGGRRLASSGCTLGERKLRELKRPEMGCHQTKTANLQEDCVLLLCYDSSDPCPACFTVGKVAGASFTVGPYHFLLGARSTRTSTEKAQRSLWKESPVLEGCAHIFEAV